MNNLRRKLLTGGASAALIAPWLGTGLLVPISASAAEWQRHAFSVRTVQDALKSYGASTAAETRDIKIVAPEIAENGAKVDVEIICNLSAVRSLALFADKNPMPLCSIIEFLPPAIPYVREQIKLMESTRIRAVARTADGRYHVAFREIKVTLGGCGG